MVVSRMRSPDDHSLPPSNSINNLNNINNNNNN